MKRTFGLWMSVCFVFLASCYGKTDSLDTASAESAISSSEEGTVYTSQNPYFTILPSYHGLFLCLSEESDSRDASIHVEEIAVFKDGAVVELTLEPVETVPEERRDIGCFYIQKDRIYKIERTEENLKQLQEGTLPENAAIVCQEEAIPDPLKEDEKGWHEFLLVDGDKREYHLYSNEVETGYYERFIWEKGRGLICYFSGWGAMRDHVELVADGYRLEDGVLVEQ